MSEDQSSPGNAEAESDDQRRRAGIRKNLRGSSLLLSGRFLSLAINLGVQVLTVRYLVREDYGMFAYGLAAVALSTNIVLLGLDKTLSRFVAVYYEQRDYPRVFGSIVTAGAGITLMSVTLVGGMLLFSGSLPRLLQADPKSVRLLLVMIPMAPLLGIDSMLHALYSVFGTARAMVVRRYIVGPGLKLGSVLGVMALGGEAFHLALAYLLSLAAGVLVYGVFLFHLLRRDGHFRRWHPRRLSVPLGSLTGYALSLAGAELIFIFYDSFVTLVLEYFHGPSEVAGFQAARPFARLNDVVLVSFVHLFVPMLARFFARKDSTGMAHLYTQTSLFITLLSFPLFAFTFGTADSIATVVLGEKYADAGVLLAWMSFGFFLQASLGTNTHTLRVLGHVRTAVAMDGLTMVVAIAACLLLIPALGALGAAATVALVVSVKGLFCLTALWWRTGLHPWREGQASTYGVVALGAAGLVAARPFVAGNPWTSALVSVVAIIAVWGFARHRLDLDDLFPELQRLPFLSRLLGPRAEA